MLESSAEVFPQTQELKAHNHLLGDLAALDAAWEQDGYWFFRDVLDKAVVAHSRQSWIDPLEHEGVIAPVGGASTEKGVAYNGASLAKYPFRICGIPLAEIDPSTGGLMLAEGMAAGKTSYHPKDAGATNMPIRLQDIPADRWRRTTYQAGNVLFMNLWTPHTGLDNRSERLRLSTDHILERDPKGERWLSIDPQTYVRNTSGIKLNGSQITDFFKPGSEVIIAYDGDRASVVRPLH